MKKIGTVTCLLPLLAAGIWLVSVRQPDAAPSLALETPLSKEFAHAAAVRQKGDYSQALELFEAGYRQAQINHETVLVPRFLWGMGNCHFALHHYQEALREYLSARDLFEKLADRASLSALNGNLASLYQRLGEFDAAVASARLALTQDTVEADRKGRRARLLILLAGLEAQAGNMRDAKQVFRAAIAEASRFDDSELLSNAWDRLGSELLLHNERNEAEEALLEAYRIRKLNRLPSLAGSYGNLGLLRFEQGDVRAATALFDASIAESGAPGGRIPEWCAYYARGRLRLAESRLPEAHSDFAAALELARDYRLMAPPADSTRVRLEGYLQQVYASFVDTSARLYQSQGPASLARDAFEALEENRGGSLAARLKERTALRRNMPPAYWDALVALESAEAAAMLTADEKPRQQVRRIRSKILEMEAQAGFASMSVRPALLARLQRSLDRDSALLSFHLGEESSWLWAVSASNLALYRLPGREVILRKVSRFRESILNRYRSSAPLGHDLYLTLFESLAPHYRSKTHWLLSLDEGLFELPFAALVIGSESAPPVYLVERHSLQIVSGAANWLETSQDRGRSASFAGIGDPVYNRADARWAQIAKRRTHAWLPPRFFPAWKVTAATLAPLGLSRLAGSGPELEACARIWRGQSTLLEGIDVTRDKIRRLVESPQAVAHFATHVVRDPSGASNALIALGLSDKGQDEFLGPSEIGGWKVEADLVVLSGCSSGAAVALPGAGLMGLTRAWLMAGAGAVVATFWPTPDDVGVFFRRFYDELQRSSSHSPAHALRAAQIEMIKGANWRSQPDYWAAYFTLGNN